jgi:2-keto-4-pentenoate hydratase/2-oxohepta-3-ene-1,7-dioic acid hydratase in catechol pathway
MMPVTLEIAGTGSSVTLGAGKIIALGLNYRDHILEMGREMPSEPVLFAKTPNVLVGNGDPIVIPAFLDDYGFDEVVVHYEAELGVIIGRRARSVSPAEAMECVLGYTCFNDVSQRNIQKSDVSGWFRGKSLDTFGPVGPVVVPASDIPDPGDLDITCRLNGKTVQEASTSSMLFPVPEIISFISRQITLEEGDLIATGTPSGVGRIRHGDRVEVEISRIGVLTNPVIEENRLA